MIEIREENFAVVRGTERKSAYTRERKRSEECVTCPPCTVFFSDGPSQSIGGFMDKVGFCP